MQRVRDQVRRRKVGLIVLPTAEATGVPTGAAADQRHLAPDLLNPLRRTADSPPAAGRKLARHPPRQPEGAASGPAFRHPVPKKTGNQDETARQPTGKRFN